MGFNFPILVVLAPLFASTVLATPVPNDGSQCNTGPAQCCNSVQPSNSPQASKLLGLLGVVAGGPNVPIGLTCTPISVIGAGSGGGCTQNPVCCQNNNFNGIVAIGCTPINISA